ncbi:hypothetical protein G6F24_013622 [Rhizopus arrhizus]|nr:hypothetical protein G6F24_013622 [Rhizopus arrhizus]
MARFFIDRPVFAWVLAIFIILAGVLAIPRLALPGGQPADAERCRGRPDRARAVQRQAPAVLRIVGGYLRRSLDHRHLQAGDQPGAGAGGCAEPDQGDRTPPAAQRAPERPVRGSGRFRLPDAGRPALAGCQCQRGGAG